jgi:serine/threonine protein kinase
MDHREIGRISLNSDMFSLGIIFYYLLNPGTKYLSGYQHTDLRDDYDFIFDVNVVNWDSVREVAGKHGEDLLKQMLELNPEDRISSIRALNHPFLKDVRIENGSKNGDRRGGSRKKEREQAGGSRRKWEVTNLASKKEYLHQRNHEEFLEPIVAQCKKTHVINLIKPKQPVPIQIWNNMYDELESFNLKFVTLNYAIYLLLSYVSIHTIKYTEDWELIAYAALYLSSKLNEYEHDISLRKFDKRQQDRILTFEKAILEIFNWALPLPIMVTKEVILYNMYMSIIYRKSNLVKLDDLEYIQHFYNSYYLLELISSLTYFSPELTYSNKLELVKVIMSYTFATIKHSSKLKKVVNNLIMSKQSLYWVGRDLIKFLEM